MLMGLPDPHSNPLVRGRVRIRGSAFGTVPKCHGTTSYKTKVQYSAHFYTQSTALQNFVLRNAHWNSRGTILGGTIFHMGTTNMVDLMHARVRSVGKYLHTVPVTNNYQF
jgi:hypothetical protein